MRSKIVLATATAVAALLTTGAALADTMHPALGARLAGMGQHGVVNLQSHAAQGKLCWKFEVHTKGLTTATVRDAHGMIVAHLGMHYAAKGCDSVPKKALSLIESKPSSYRVWVDTKAHRGELRGKLFAGMAHM
jgi:hypothetical protein